MGYFQSFLIGLCSDRHDHNVLDIDSPIGMQAPADDLNFRQRKGRRFSIGKVFIDLHAPALRCGIHGSHGYSKNGIGAQAGFIIRAVECDQGIVKIALGKNIVSTYPGSDFTRDIGNGTANRFTTVFFWVTIAQFQGLKLACRGSGRNQAAAPNPIFQRYPDFQRRVPARIKYLQRINCSDVHDSIP